jgi:hypothetical protein
VPRPASCALAAVPVSAAKANAADAPAMMARRDTELAAL